MADYGGSETRENVSAVDPMQLFYEILVESGALAIIILILLMLAAGLTLAQLIATLLKLAFGAGEP